MNDWSDEKTDDPHYADRRNFYKVGCTPATISTRHAEYSSEPQSTGHASG
jgi:hypothetical protein